MAQVKNNLVNIKVLHWLELAFILNLQKQESFLINYFVKQETTSQELLSKLKTLNPLHLCGCGLS